MRICTLMLTAALTWAVSVPPSFALNQSKKEIKRNLKAQKKAEEAAEKRRQLLAEIQPQADRYAVAMVTRTYPDSLVQGYINTLGQSLVPPETPASTTFSFRVVQDIYPNASALPDGRIYVTTGLLAHVDNEAQLAMVLGHEIGHVIEEHALGSLRKQRSDGRRNKILGAAAGAAIGGLIGGKKGGAAAAIQAATAGGGAGLLAAMFVNSVARTKYNKKAEKEADLIGTKLALARGFDPDEASRFWDNQHQRFGKRSLNTKVANSLFGAHPLERIRAENIRALLAGDMKSTVSEKRAGGELATGTPRFGSVISGLMRDTGILMAERSDRHDLAIRLLERSRKYRPNDPRLLWALGRTYRMVARSEEKIAEADRLLAMAVEQDKRRLYPAVHRDLAYAIASQSEDNELASAHLRKYVTGHIGIHGSLPSDIDDVYDKLVLFGDNEWAPEVPAKPAPPQTTLTANGNRYHPTVWDTPADLASYDASLLASTQQIENAFGAVLPQGKD